MTECAVLGDKFRTKRGSRWPKSISSAIMSSARMVTLCRLATEASFKLLKVYTGQKITKQISHRELQLKSLKFLENKFAVDTATDWVCRNMFPVMRRYWVLDSTRWLCCSASNRFPRWWNLTNYRHRHRFTLQKVFATREAEHRWAAAAAARSSNLLLLSIISLIIYRVGGLRKLFSLLSQWNSSFSLLRWKHRKIMGIHADDSKHFSCEGENVFSATRFEGCEEGASRRGVRKWCCNKAASERSIKSFTFRERMVRTLSQKQFDETVEPLIVSPHATRVSMRSVSDDKKFLSI